MTRSWIAHRAVATAKSICFDGRAFAVFGGADGSAFFAKDGDAQVPDFMVDLAEGGFGKFVRRCEFLLELRHAFQGAIL
jgi:hypothetical protein